MCAERTYDGATPFNWRPLEILIDFLSAEEELIFRGSMFNNNNFTLWIRKEFAWENSMQLFILYMSNLTHLNLWIHDLMAWLAWWKKINSLIHILLSLTHRLLLLFSRCIVTAIYFAFELDACIATARFDLNRFNNIMCDVLHGNSNPAKALFYISTLSSRLSSLLLHGFQHAEHFPIPTDVIQLNTFFFRQCVLSSLRLCVCVCVAC